MKKSRNVQYSQHRTRPKLSPSTKTLTKTEPFGDITCPEPFFVAEGAICEVIVDVLPSTVVPGTVDTALVRTVGTVLPPKTVEPDVVVGMREVTASGILV